MLKKSLLNEESKIMHFNANNSNHQFEKEDHNASLNKQIAIRQNNLGLVEYQHSISDDVKVGFYSTDRVTQTNETEIIVLKNATENLDYLCKEMNIVKYDLNFAKNSFKNQFDFELHNKSIEIYGVINEKILKYKSQHEEDLLRIRAAYKSQLANAVVKVSKMIEEHYNERLIELTKKKAMSQFKDEEYISKIKELQRTIAEQEIQMKEIRENANKVDASEKIKTEYEAKIEKLNDERDELLNEFIKVQQKVARMEDALNIKDEETEKMMSEMTSLQLELEKEKIINQQISKEFQEFRTKTEQEKLKIKKEFDKQKVSIESKMHEKLKESREQIMNAAKQELKQQQEVQQQQTKMLIAQKKQQDEEYQRFLKEQEELLEKERLEKLNKEAEIEAIKKKTQQDQEKANQDLEKEKLTLQEVLQKEKEKEIIMNSVKTTRKEDMDLIMKLKNNELNLKYEITKLKRELHRNNEEWEKKFDILKHSLHAIKDEMYLREKLKKQSSQLAYASVAYTMDQPPAIPLPAQQLTQSIDSNKFNQQETKSLLNKSVLPSINNNTTSKDRQMSFTISVPSRLSVQMENDEAQIIDDEEMNKLKEEYLNDVSFIPAQQN